MAFYLYSALPFRIIYLLIQVEIIFYLKPQMGTLLTRQICGFPLEKMFDCWQLNKNLQQIDWHLDLTLYHALPAFVVIISSYDLRNR